MTAFTIGLVSVCPASTGFGQPSAEVKRLNADDGETGDLFGVSVSMSGDRAIVGARGDNDHGERSGAAYVFERDGNGTWNEVVKLIANDGADGDEFGISVSISGDWALVGARGDDDNGERTGAAYVFERDDSGTWSEVAKLTASDGETSARFGASVSIAIDRAVVGAMGDNDYTGAAYVFERDASDTWNEVARLADVEGVEGDVFGCSVSVSGNRVLIGAEGDEQLAQRSGSPNVFERVGGSAFVFERESSGAWSQVAKLSAGDIADFDRFGFSVSISGDRALVGAPDVRISPLDDVSGGAAYLFERDTDGNWIKVQKFTASDGAPDDAFGVSVSIFGEYAVVGARKDDNCRGSAYVFEGVSDGTWNEVMKLSANDGSESELFGFSVSISDERVLVGSVWGDGNSRDSGSAYLFEPALSP